VFGTTLPASTATAPAATRGDLSLIVPDKLYGLSAGARAIDMHPSTFWGWVRAGKVAVLTVGRRKKVLGSALLAFVGLTAPPPPPGPSAADRRRRRDELLAGYAAARKGGAKKRPATPKG
jgi:hypothetical protein